ncbi:MAG: cell division protein [Caulobacteraceae bacterium]|nr:cell division protein [Caulobacteraceae bacterium]
MTAVALPRPKSRWRPSPLLPGADARDGALTFVVAVLCFLACLTAIAALGADRAARGWQTELVGSATVLVRPKPGETADAAAARAAEAVAGVKGVVQATALERDKANALLKPWLGDEDLLADLPVPRLVAVELEKKDPAKANALKQALAAAGVDATVDDHTLWLADIVRAAQGARLAAFGVFSLLFAAAGGVIVFATRAALESRRDVVQILHLSGAEDRFIAGLFMERFGRMAALAGVIGAAAAALVTIVLRLSGGGHGLTPVLPVAWSDLLFLIPAPLIAAVIAAVAARIVALKLVLKLT